MDYSLGDVIGGCPFLENTLGDEILDFFLEQPVKLIIPAHCGGPLSVENLQLGTGPRRIRQKCENCRATLAVRMWWASTPCATGPGSLRRPPCATRNFHPTNSER